MARPIDVLRVRMLALKRRAFLSAAAAAAAGCGVRGAAPGYRVLTEAEVNALEEWCEALIPGDQDPGAKDARVVRFIDVQLTRKYRVLLPKYRDALRGFIRYRAANPGTATEVLLAAMELGRVPKEYFPDGGGKPAFEMVLAHTMQGYYGSPRHGGNLNFASWRMLRVPVLPVRGRQQYRIGGASS